MKEMPKLWECPCKSMVIKMAINIGLLPITAFCLVQWLMPIPAVLRLSKDIATTANLGEVSAELFPGNDIYFQILYVVQSLNSELTQLFSKSRSTSYETLLLSPSNLYIQHCNIPKSCYVTTSAW